MFGGINTYYGAVYTGDLDDITLESSGAAPLIGTMAIGKFGFVVVELPECRDSVLIGKEVYLNPNQLAGLIMEGKPVRVNEAHEITQGLCQLEVSGDMTLYYTHDQH